MSTAREMEAGEAGFVLCELEWVRTRLLVLLSCGEPAEFAVVAADGVADVGPGLVRRLREATDEIETGRARRAGRGQRHHAGGPRSVMPLIGRRQSRRWRLCANPVPPCCADPRQPENC